MKPSQRAGWKRTHIANRLMVWITAIVALATVCLAVAAVFQYLTAREQSKAAREQAEAARKSVNIAADQSQAVKDSAQAAKDSASAAQTQTNLSKQLVAQNEKSINAAIDQSKSAQQSVGIAQRSFSLLERPAIGVESITVPTIEVNARVLVRVHLRNFGHIPAQNVTARTYVFVRPSKDTDPCVDVPTTNLTQLSGVDTHTFFAVNGTKTATGTSIIAATPVDIERIVATKTYWIYVYLSLKYGERREYFLEYYTRWNVETQAWEDCGTHNRAN